MKKGQITVFFIIALIVVMVIAFGFYYRYSILEYKDAAGIVLPADARIVKEELEECMYNVGLESLYHIGLHGGYSIPPLRALNVGSEFIPFLYYEGDNLVPAISVLEDEISVHIKNLLPNCLSITDNRGFELVHHKPKIKTRILSKYVDIEMSYPVVLAREETEFKLSEPYSIRYPIKLGEIYFFVSKIVEGLVKGDYAVDFEHLSSSRFNITISMHEGNSLLYIIEDPESIVDDGAYAFAFANKFEE